MKISAAFPSEYLRAADLDERPHLFVMERVEMRDVGDDHKPVLFFQNTEKGLVTNKTNGNTIASIYGDDTDGWVGKEIVLFPTYVDFQGRQVEAIRVRAPKKKPAAQPVAPPLSTAKRDDMDDSVSF